ncbi:MAG TPA: NAD(P)-dependent oxidoreductase [Candidatus Latescibacteria bacterium]|jgi:nucleoside-diphosphate-sugar epimerase|nr:epimerase [Gemmatimonadaceae bacterium]MDP6014930.1 NAD(P)-dependent oxidoreductase [Candidatus Latescibacterota bacterium]HJP33205.1 NAD(P)-dependent oxidoreductase [Candidatus Latescibacterota bacterium]
MRIGITGGAGHVGSLLHDGLGNEHDIVRFDRTAADGVRAVRFDRAEEVDGLFDGLQAIIHLAADPSPEADWDSVCPNNVKATYQVMEECRRAGVGRVVFASTNHVMHGHSIATTPETLDPSKKLSMTAADPPNPDSLYAVSKLFGEHLGKLYSERFGIEFVAMRIGWTTRSDDPGQQKGTPSADYMRAMWLSHRDCVQIFGKALSAPLRFFIAYATSDNTRKVFDLTETCRVLDYEPQDNAEPAFL